ncbi:class I SAM-dependent methyltransferase [Granulicella sp. L60]|uniref:class I SAM-dependent methyltransferase n=1 Tax=Granulicella sp. L60 TaxID=1641866 RepID=UPI00131AC958
MKINETTALIRTPLIDWARPQSWCDLGCGNGAFTAALAQLLAPGSTIYAIDFDQRALDRIPDQYDEVEVRKIIGDIQSPSLCIPSTDGMLLANALHFIRDQHTFLRRLLSLTDSLLIVEYERSKPNPWGPYPVGSVRLRELLNELGVEQLEKLTTRPSRFGGTMYSAFARRSRA